MSKKLTEDSLIKNLLYTSVPTMIGFGAQMLYDIVDLFWIGMISSQAVASVTIFSTLFWVVEAFNEIIGTSSVSLISQNFGRNDIKRTEQAIEQTMTFKFLVALLAALATALFLKPLLSFFSHEQSIINYAMEYGYIRLFFLPIMFSSYTVNTALRCIGDAKTPMVIMIIVSIMNMVLDPLFMFKIIPGTSIPGLNLGVFGAALATIITQTTAFLIGFYVLFSGKAGIKPSIKGLFKLDRELDIKLITIGLPSGMEVFMKNIFNVVSLKFVSMFGTAAVAASGFASKIFGMGFMPLIGLSISGSAIVGQALGNEDVKLARRASNISGRIGVAIMACFTFFSVLFGQQIIGVFTNDAQVIKYGADFLNYGSFGLIFLAYSFGITAAFSGSGYMLPVFVSSTVSRWAVQLPVMVMGVYLFKDIFWVWLAWMFGDVSELVVNYIFYKKSQWYKKRVH
ncbi:MAG TPA: MATE family efflux transporter [Petrotogaceae bacterium]|nr:MATE family efflux transporter [Petrotogaceae bacterium]